MDNISRVRAFSSPELRPSSTMQIQRPEDFSLEGIATNVKLLLKLIQENHEASLKDNDDRKMQRIAGMITILDDVKSRIEKSHPEKTKMAEFRRCNTELRPDRGQRAKKPQEPIMDEKEKLRKQLSASLAVQKGLEIVCSSLGKEKKIMASELARKAHEASEMEEFVDDLKAQNKTLLTKLQAHAAEQEKKCSIGGEAQGNAALQERNKELSQQLLQSLDSYRTLKRKYREAKEQKISIFTTIEEIGEEASAGLERIRTLRQRMIGGNHQSFVIEEEISELEKMFERFSTKLSSSEHEKTSIERATRNNPRSTAISQPHGVP